MTSTLRRHRSSTRTTRGLFHGEVVVALNLKITWRDGALSGKYQQGLLQTVNNGPETTAYILALGAPGANAPETLEEAMSGRHGSVAYVLNVCNDWKLGPCNFSSVFANAARQLNIKPYSLLNDIRMRRDVFEG